MTDAERAELPSSLFLLSGTNPFRRAAVWVARWFLFEWIIIFTIIGKFTPCLMMLMHSGNFGMSKMLREFCQQTFVNTNGGKETFSKKKTFAESPLCRSCLVVL